MIALPAHAAGMRIGLFGGSFNPPHEGHLNMSRQLMRALNLDRVWWLVTPGNPLKPREDLKTESERIALAHSIIDDRRIVPTALESDLGTRYSVDTIAALRALCPEVRFVWLMGADNLAQFHLWRDWRGIAASLPFAVYDRPGWTNRSLRGKAALALSRYRIDESDSTLLPVMAPPAWVFVHGRRSAQSSSAIRRKSRA